MPAPLMRHASQRLLDKFKKHSRGRARDAVEVVAFIVELRCILATLGVGETKFTMSTDSIGVLRQLAGRFKTRLSRCEIYDPNVCTSKTVPGRPWELIPVAGEPFSHRLLQYVHRHRRITVFANKMYVHGAVKGIFATGVLTVNAEGKIGFRSQYATTVRANGKEYPVFTENGSLSPEQATLLKRPELLALIKESDLQESESIHFTNGDLSFYLRSPTLGRITESIDRMIDLANQIETREEELDLRVPPLRFNPLIPLTKKWAVGDDLEREDLLARSSRAELRALVEKVEPYLTSIDSYLDSFGDRPPSAEAAAVLGKLAECAVEAKLYLTRKKRSRTSPLGGASKRRSAKH